jgi:hypothetical protein
LNISGTERDVILMLFDHEPDLAEILARLEKELPIPLLPNDRERTAFLTLRALGALRDRLAGSRDALERSRALAQRFLDAIVLERVGEKLLRTLRDSEDHDYGLVVERDGLTLAVLVRTYLGTFKATAPKLAGRFLPATFKDFDYLRNRAAHVGKTPAGLLAADFFIEDVVQGGWYLAAALSFVPDPRNAPEDLRCLLVHKEMLSEEEWRSLNEAVPQAGTPGPAGTRT